MKVVSSFLNQWAGKKAAPADNEDFAGFRVEDRDNGRVVHSECVGVGRMSDERVADFMVQRRERLEKKYAPSRYEVDAGLFNSEASFAHFFGDS